jgi:2-polyprenyl-3-methyl-5-hydroxy-6-metoxy-1,4-benzoquinol methylase
MGAYYSATSCPCTSHPGGSSPIGKWLFRYGLRKRCRPLLKRQPPGRILDIGCGEGHFLAEMRKHGWEPIGLDRDPRKAAFARDVLTIEAHGRRFEDADFASEAFDAVTMWDSLEHLHHPRAALREIRRILKPEGYLLLRVPSLDSLDARLFGPYWAGLDPPRHLTVLSRKTLLRLLGEAGFTVERMWCMSGSHASFVISLRYLSERGTHSGVLSGMLSVLLGVVSSPVGSVVGAPYFGLLDRLSLGPEITALARRDDQNGDA